MGVFLRDHITYLHEFRRKRQKTLNGYVDNRDRGLNLALPSIASSLVGRYRAKQKTFQVQCRDLAIRCAQESKNLVFTKK